MKDAQSRIREDIAQVLSHPLSAHSRGRLAELYVALEFNLELAPSRVERGWDCVDPDSGERWEVKYRSAGIQFVDANHMDGFARMVLVNFADDGSRPQFWIVEQPDLGGLFRWREGFGKWQARQVKFKGAGRHHSPGRAETAAPSE